MTIALCTFCHPPHYVEKLHRPSVLRKMVESHATDFDSVVVIHQRCRAQDYAPFDIPCRTVDLPEKEFDGLLIRFNVNPINPYADEISHGPGGAHYWRHHLVNHLRGLEVTDTDYVVFADCDTRIVGQPGGRTWIQEGIYLLEAYPHVLVVSPGDGGEAGGGMAEGGKLPNGARLTRNMSQQLFLCRGNQFRREVNFDVPWDRKYNAPGGPLQEWYVMGEGRIGRYMDQSGTWRAVLPDKWRYWHESNFDPH